MKDRQLYIDGTPIKPVTDAQDTTIETVTGVGEAMPSMFTDAKDIDIEVTYAPPPAEFRLTVYGTAADYFRNIIAKDQLFRLEGISFEDSLEVTFTEVVED
jgi:hypothetical protein